MADSLRDKWKPITRWVPEMQRAQTKVLGEESVWVPLDRMCAHVGIETGYTGDPDILSRGVNTPSGNCVATGACAPDLRAHGLFQIWFPGFNVNWTKIHDPEYNCYAGAKTLALKYKQCGNNWRAASLAFFAGSCVDIGVIDHSTGTSQARYDEAMRQNIKELNSLGIGTGEDNPDPKDPTKNGSTSTPDDESSNQCVTILGKEICAPNTSDLIGGFITSQVQQLFPRLLLLLVGLGILFVGVKAIT